MKLDELTKETFADYAIRSYTNYHCTGLKEFQSDLLHIKYLKPLFRKYKATKSMDDSRIRLALNHIIILYNNFKNDAITRMLFFKLEPELHGILKTFLEYLSFMPATVKSINGKNIKSKNIKIDKHILAKIKSV